MLDSETENELVVQALGGDEIALERLLLASYDQLSRRLARKLPATLRGSISEEDILQQVFISALIGRDEYLLQDILFGNPATGIHLGLSGPRHF